MYVAVDGLGDIASQQFLDLEVFLLGIQQQKTLPILKEHGVTLETLFTMTKEDLNQVGWVKYQCNEEGHKGGYMECLHTPLCEVLYRILSHDRGMGYATACLHNFIPLLLLSLNCS